MQRRNTIKQKENTKIKLISLLSAVVLWMYVMAVVDPEDTKLFENIPVVITNLNELKEKDLVIYPEKDITTDIYVTGKLSNIQKVTKDDINVYGEIRSPIEGKNQIRLKVSTSQRISADFKNPVMIVTLEKIINEERDITINIETWAIRLDCYTYQPKLESGVNIKTINNQSILGSGNITIEGGGTGGSGNIQVVEVDSDTIDLIIG